MEFYRKNATSRGKFEVVGVYVDLDGENETLADIDKNGLSAIEANVWNRQRIQFPIVLDNSFTTYERYGVPGFGTVVLVDPGGRIAQGDASTLQAILDKAEPSAAAASPSRRVVWIILGRRVADRHRYYACPHSDLSGNICLLCGGSSLP